MQAIDVPVVRAGALEAGDADREEPVLDGFLARELVGDICDAGLVRRRFAFEFPDESFAVLDRGIKVAGYYEDHGLLFRKGETPSAHFMRLLGACPSFAKGDAGPRTPCGSMPPSATCCARRFDHRVLVYEDDS
ncbi:MAG: hypothetical protein ACLT5H_10185 [Collinsella stercoris]|uniref:hypothetical protein n=1 Tax=Collinsella stercoris TaxID=147206 RepID=UPI0039941654